MSNEFSTIEEEYLEEGEGEIEVIEEEEPAEEEEQDVDEEQDPAPPAKKIKRAVLCAREKNASLAEVFQLVASYRHQNGKRQVFINPQVLHTYLDNAKEEFSYKERQDTFFFKESNSQLKGGVFQMLGLLMKSAISWSGLVTASKGPLYSKISYLAPTIYEEIQTICEEKLRSLGEEISSITFQIFCPVVGKGVNEPVIKRTKAANLLRRTMGNQDSSMSTLSTIVRTPAQPADALSFSNALLGGLLNVAEKNLQAVCRPTSTISQNISVTTETSIVQYSAPLTPASELYVELKIYPFSKVWNCEKKDIWRHKTMDLGVSLNSGQHPRAMELVYNLATTLKEKAIAEEWDQEVKQRALRLF